MDDSIIVVNYPDAQRARTRSHSCWLFSCNVCFNRKVTATDYNLPMWFTQELAIPQYAITVIQILWALFYDNNSRKIPGYNYWMLVCWASVLNRPLEVLVVLVSHILGIILHYYSSASMIITSAYESVVGRVPEVEFPLPHHAAIWGFPTKIPLGWIILNGFICLSTWISMTVLWCFLCLTWVNIIIHWGLA